MAVKKIHFHIHKSLVQERAFIDVAIKCLQTKTYLRVNKSTYRIGSQGLLIF